MKWNSIFWLSGVVVLRVVPLFAQTSTPGWTPDLMISFQRITGTAFAPKGKFLAYQVEIPVTEADESKYITHIWLASADGTSDRQFTHGEASSTMPAFSPDGTVIAYLSDRGSDATNQIWLASLAGGEPWQLTTAEKGVLAYKWAPDGKSLAFTAIDPASDAERSMQRQKLNVTIRDHNFKNAHLYKVSSTPDAFGKYVTRRLTTGPFHISSPFGPGAAFDWSPDGRSIAFVHRETPALDSWPTTDISILSLADGQIEDIVTRPGFDGSPLYSPDGKWLAFVSDGGQPRWGFAHRVNILPLNGKGDPVTLASTLDEQPELIAWTENSKHLLFSETEGTTPRLFSLPINGQLPRALTTGPGSYTQVSVSSRGDKIALVYETSETLPNVYVTSISQPNLKKISNINAAFPRLPLGKTELLSWTSTEGQKIEGLLTYPVHYELDKLYPMILMIHGGPTGVYTQSYTAAGRQYPIQAFAQAGYAILRANPRGSSGYGKPFRFANYNDWGIGDFEDLMNGVNEVVRMNVAHPDSLCVMGWSYGGYMTAMIITKSNQFKAASVGAGVTDLMSFTGTTDIPSFIPDYFDGEPWEIPEIYSKFSAMSNIKGVSIPTQIIHGEEDKRVPLGQSLELYNALRRQNVPTEMLIYPRMGHSSREPRQIMDIGKRVLAWFDHQLGRGKRQRSMTFK